MPARHDEAVLVDLGIQSADAEGVSFRFQDGKLHLEFVDWREQHQSVTFADVMAFRWQAFDEADLRDDATYEVLKSTWLARQSELQSVPADGLAHYKLCFNACGCLDVICRRRPLPR